jgi:MFS family permease
MAEENIGAPRPEAPAWYRWAVLMVISLAMFGNYYLYDTIAPIADLLKEQLSFSDEQIGLLYSSYSLGAMIFLLLGGIYIDRYGTRAGTMLFGIICAVSGFVVIISDSFTVMMAGRFLLGVGAEPLIVAITAAIAKWFRGKELAFAMGINLLIARLASVAADLSPTWARDAYANWHDPLVIGAIMGLTCIVGAIIYWILEKRGEARYALSEAGGTDKLVLSDLYKFGRSFWVITALCVTFYSIIFPFRSFAIKFFIEAHGAARDVAGQLNSVLPFASMIATPLVGLLVDKIGKRASLMALGTLVMVPVFPILAYTDIPLVAPVTMLGIAFSLIPAIMWPAVAYIVEQKRLGSAYALMFLLQQGGVLLLEWMVGKSNDVAGASAANPAGYLPMMWMFTLLGVVALGSAILLWRIETGPKASGLETIKA